MRPAGADCEAGASRGMRPQAGAWGRVRGDDGEEGVGLIVLLIPVGWHYCSRCVYRERLNPVGVALWFRFVL